MPGERSKTFDIFKGLGIVAIVFTHIIINTENGIATSPKPNFLMEIGYSGLMMFFMIAGFFYKNERNFLENVKKRAIQLAVLWIGCTILLPFLLWCWINVVGPQAVSINEYFDTVAKLLTLGSAGLMPYDMRLSDSVGLLFVNCGYYFIEAMFFGLIIFYAVANFASKSAPRIVSTVLILITATFLIRQFTDCRCVFSIQLAPLAAAYMLVGYAAKKYNVYEYVETQWKTAKYWILFAICLVVGVTLAIVLPSGLEFVQTRFAPWDLHNEWYYNLRIYTFFLSTLICCYFLLVLTSMFSKLKVSNIFSLVGRHTLGILMLHGLVIKMISFPIFGFPENNYFPIEIKQNLFVILGLGLAAITISIAISVLADKGMKTLCEKIAKRHEGK